jgi:hypothetical protein
MDFTVFVFSQASHPWLVFTAILLPGNCLTHCDRPPLGSVSQAKPSLVGWMQTGDFTNDPVYINEEEGAIWAFYYSTSSQILDGQVHLECMDKQMVGCFNAGD